MIVRAIIQARMTSSRLRGKSLMSVLEKPLLYRVVENVKSFKFIDEITIATTSSEADKPIVSAAKELGVGYFQGSRLNLINRFIQASEDMNDNDIIVRFTADNPICFENIANSIYERIFNKDYVAIDNLSHIAPEFIKVSALRKLSSITSNPIDIEHVTTFFRRKQGIELFNVEILPINFMGIRPDLDKYLTVDTKKDLIRLEKIFSNVTDMSLSNLYEYLDKNIDGGIDSEIPTVNLDGKLVGEYFSPYIIAEIGQNHNGSIDLAKKIIDMAKRCGADAVKFQKRDIDSELTKEAFNKPYDSPNSFGVTYGEHRKFLELSKHEHLELKEYCDIIGITYFCTPCDVPSLEILEEINCPFYKVASRDLTNIPLLKRLGQLKKIVIISTGMASIEDIDNAIDALDLPKEMLIIMQCVSQYPCDVKNVNLKVIETLKNKYKTNVGLSDHTSGIIVPAVATSMGATVIEKHVTLDRTMKGTDQPGSLEEQGLNKLIQYINTIQLAMGDGIKEINPATKEAKEKLSRSLTSSSKIKKGEFLTEDKICLKSPGTGIKWSDKEIILNKIAKIDINPNVTLRLDDFE